MKAKSKSEIADAAGVSYSTLARWISEKRSILETMGCSKHQKVMPPKIVKYICEEYGINEEDFR